MPILLEIELKNPVDLSADALLLPTNNDLILGQDITSGIRRKCGPELQAECDKLSPIRLGDVAVTLPFGINYKCIIHMAVMKIGLWPDDRTMQKALYKATDICNQRKYESIVIPNLEGESTVYSTFKAAKLIGNIIYSRHPTSIKKVILSCVTEKAYKDYCDILRYRPASQNDEQKNITTNPSTPPQPS
ncbi:MAG: macro domain-containing protein [Planctomycetes bacterium]|nr:macro domain-containing protein [Planctomycetota bacterium]